MKLLKIILPFIFVLAIQLFALPYTLNPTHAQEEGDTCTYKEEQNDGFYKCQGTIQDEVCKFDESGNVVPDCQKDPDQSGASGQTPTDSTTGTPPNDKNWGPRQQNAFWSTNSLDGFGCLVVGDFLSDNPDPNANDDEGKMCPGEGPDGQVMVYNRLPGGGALGGLGTVMVALYTNPSLSSSEYLASIGENLGIKNAYAQNIGSGTSSGDAVIKPVLKLWQISRNLSYLAFILVFIAIGFMIMLRAKISPQAVITAQSALPGLVIGLILVTFSYFLSALIIDLSFIGMNLVVFLFRDIPTAVQNPAQIGADVSVFALFKSFVLNGTHLNSLVLPVKDAFQSSIGIFQPGMPNIFGWAVGGVVGGIIGILVMFIVLIAILIQMFRLLWELISSYIAIFVTTIFAPFIILSSSLPGRGGKMDLWWKSLLGNALVFPAVFAAFLFAGVFLGNTDSTDFKQTLPLFAGLPVEILRVIIAYGIVLGTPAIPGMVKKAIGVPELGGLPQEALKGLRAGQGAAAPLGTEARGFAVARTVKSMEAGKALNRPANWIARQPYIGSVFNAGRARLENWSKKEEGKK